jgi:multicomponent Na+:H+ antiporter subunit C
MSTQLVFGICGAALASIGFYALLAGVDPLRRVLGFNLAGSGIFLLFGNLAARAPHGAPDPVPQAMIITGIVVSLAATALALALAIRLRAREEGGDGAAGDGHGAVDG